ncbi:hypothetical protein MTR67_030763 [Solanum verrucosum]|uniref:Retrotransposon gag domain-containing protein n=1 Tax=Solanum verrucosum TaxID=315347 RepID=A0AAF0U175_SOLVR|nr:hypothetical protein MTR67_030763 [Solanum verrucosum]
MRVTVTESVKLASYQLKYVAHIWFTQWKENMCGSAAHVTWDCFTEAFLDIFFLRELREAKAQEFMNLKQGSIRFVEGFSSIASPLTKLTQKKVKFQWSDECEKTLLELKTRLTTSPVLTLREGLDGYMAYCHRILQYVFTQKELNLHQRRWLEFLVDYDMNMLYHLGKANVVVDALSRLSMGSVAHVEEEKKELAKDVHQLACLGVCPIDTLDGGVIVQNGSESSLIVEVNEK